MACNVLGGFARQIFACAICCSALAGCASMPPFDIPENSEKRPTVANVVDKIECEIAEGRAANSDQALNNDLQKLGLAEFNQWAASVTLSLTVNDTGGLSPTSGLSLSYLQPYHVSPQGLVLGGNALFYQQRQRIFTQTYTMKISSIPQQETCESIKRKWDNFNLEGDLGLKDQITIGLRAFQTADASTYIPASVKTGSPDSFGGTVSFDVFKGITSLGPTWTLSTFKGVGGGAGYQRDDLDKIAITFAPAKYQGPVPLPPTRPPHGAKVEFMQEYQSKLQTYQRNLRTYRMHVAAASSNAVEAARQANAQLVTTQAIQQLGQILSTH